MSDSLNCPAAPLSVFDMFRIGIGPSSSHTVGPMRAARLFAIEAEKLLGSPNRIVVELYSSLGATGRGHSTDRATLLGLFGYVPETVPTKVVESVIESVRTERRILLGGRTSVPFDLERDLFFLPGRSLEFHPNAMRLSAHDGLGNTVLERTYYSVGGGFVVTDIDDATATSHEHPTVPWSFSTGNGLLDVCNDSGLDIAEVMLANECARQSPEAVHDKLLGIWGAMAECIEAGCATDGVLPGGLEVPRRAAPLYRKLLSETPSSDPLHAIDWVNLYALAVNEENAAGHRVVTAPTNGAAGIIPAVLQYYRTFIPGADDAGTARFLLAAAAIGIIIKSNASIAGSEVGCQGEVGSACAMAAAGLAEVLGGTPEQVENAAEIAMEHNLGLTCDPIGGLVQIPCIERNAIGAVKSINAARMALHGDGRHTVSLDTVIATMRQTGLDMHSKYKETSLGGLAVSYIEC